MRAAQERLVQEWMRADVITINPELRVQRVWELMERQRVRHLPVVTHDSRFPLISVEW